MFDKKLHTSILFAIEPSVQDWQNFVRSKVDRIQIFLEMALKECPKSDKKITWAQYLWELGYEVITRIPELEFEFKNPMELVLEHRSIAKYLYATIMGNEPDHDYDLTDRSPNWGNNPDRQFPQGKAWYHAYRISLFTELMQSIPEVASGHLRLITPGWSIRQIGESDPEQPGQLAWAEICNHAYSDERIYANGVHIYEYYWNDIDKTRALRALGRMEKLLPQDLWINEFNILHGTDMEQMLAFTEFGDMIRSHHRVSGLGLFTGNGVPNSWPSSYLVQDPHAYYLLRNWMNS